MITTNYAAPWSPSNNARYRRSHHKWTRRSWSGGADRVEDIMDLGGGDVRTQDPAVEAAEAARKAEAERKGDQRYTGSRLARKTGKPLTKKHFLNV
jgi:hypothetical protein